VSVGDLLIGLTDNGFATRSADEGSIVVLAIVIGCLSLIVLFVAFLQFTNLVSLLNPSQ
jgi:hypothetical protein